MTHDHDHHHDHGGVRNRAFGWGIALNFGFVVVEAIFGLRAHSVALLSDAGHNLGDVLGLVVAWSAAMLATRPPSRRHTYGLRRGSILAALANALLLVAATGAIAWEAATRLRHPSEVHGVTMIAVAAVGVFVNGGSALLFMRDRERDINVRSAFVHLAGDAAIAAGVCVAGGVILATGWSWVDPVVSLVVCVLVLASTWGLLHGSMALALDAVPSHVDLEAVRRYLNDLPDVTGVHDLHVWPLSTTEVALTAHLVMPSSEGAPTFLARVAEELHERFEIDHATIQIDPDEAPACSLAPDDVV